MNIRVVNDSSVFTRTEPASVGGPSQLLSDEIDLLGRNDILFVTAAGNTGENNDRAAVRRYPCGYDRPTEICVTSSSQRDGLPSWANRGPTTVDLAAPGSNIYSTLRNGKYGFISGGSMASAQVAGAAALILSTTKLSAVALKADILNHVDRLPALAGLVRTGGRLDVCKALPHCGTPGPSPSASASSPPSAPASAAPSTSGPPSPSSPAPGTAASAIPGGQGGGGGADAGLPPAALAVVAAVVFVLVVGAAVAARQVSRRN